MIKTGDVVVHNASGERWRVAWAELNEDGNDGIVIPTGYPEIVARLNECQLVESVPEDESIQFMKEIANGSSGRAEKCRAELVRLGIMEAPAAAPPPRPPIMTLCTSPRNAAAIPQVARAATMTGRIVLWDWGQVQPVLPEQRQLLRAIQFARIDLADELYVCNFGGTIEPQMAGEIQYAAQKGKAVRFMEPEGGGRGAWVIRSSRSNEHFNLQAQSRLE